MINTKIFMDSFEKLIPKESAPMFATIGSVYTDGVTLIFDGTSTATTKHYKCNTSATLEAGDRVKISKNSGTYVVEYAVGAPGGGGGGGGLTIDLLWENEDPTATFAAQTISLNTLSAYKFIIVNSKSTGGCSSVFVVGCVDSIDRWTYIFGTTSVTNIYRRELKLASNGIVVSDCAKANATTTINNNVCIPWTVYGIK